MAGESLLLAIAEVGSGGDRLVVFAYGLLSSHTTWRYLVGGLGQDHHLILVDMPGCASFARACTRCQSSGFA